MPYPQRFMEISKLVALGLPRNQLKRYVHIEGFPARRKSPSPKSPWLIDTEKFDAWYEKYGGRV